MNATSYSGDFELPKELVLDFKDYEGVSDDPLSVRLVRMLSLHPQLVRFREMKDLAKMDEPTKKMLVSDMARALGIRPFNAACST